MTDATSNTIYKLYVALHLGKILLNKNESIHNNIIGFLIKILRYRFGSVHVIRYIKSVYKN